MNPTDWLGLQLLKATTGEYIGDGPWGRPVAPTLWGLAGRGDDAMTAGRRARRVFKTAAQIFRKGGISVDATNTHQDFLFTKTCAVRAELREALGRVSPGVLRGGHRPETPEE